MLARSIHSRRSQMSIASVLAIAFLLMWGIVSSAAQKETEIQDGRDPGDAIVRVEVICGTESQEYERRIQTGFLVGKEGGEPYVVTSNDQLEFTNKDKKALSKKNRLKEDTQLNTVINAVFAGDMRVGMSLVARSRQKNLAIFRLNQNVTEKYRLLLSDKDEKIDNPRKVTMVYFPSNMEVGKYTTYTAETALKQHGELVASASGAEDHTKYYRDTFKRDKASSGAPILDEDNTVLAMCLSALNPDAASDKQNALSLRSSEIAEFLERNDILFDKPAEKVIEDSSEKKNNNGGWIVYMLGGIILILAVILAAPLIRGMNVKGAASKGSEKGQSLSNKKTKKTGPKNNACLLRISAEEVIRINEPTFTLGRSSTTCDYFVSNNAKISKTHGRILCKGKDYYYEDLHSSNGSYINGARVEAGQSILLKDRDEIKLADERFVFRKDKK